MLLINGFTANLIYYDHGFINCSDISIHDNPKSLINFASHIYAIASLSYEWQLWAFWVSNITHFTNFVINVAL